MCFTMLLYLGHGEIHVRSIYQSKRKYIYKEVNIELDSQDIWTYVCAYVCGEREREREIYIYTPVNNHF